MLLTLLTKELLFIPVCNLKPRSPASSLHTSIQLRDSIHHTDPDERVFSLKTGQQPPRRYSSPLTSTDDFNILNTWVSGYAAFMSVALDVLHGKIFNYTVNKFFVLWVCVNMCESPFANVESQMGTVQKNWNKNFWEIDFFQK